MKHGISKTIVVTATVSCLSLAPLCAAFCAPASPASAPDFSVVAPSDALYAQLQIARRAGWTSMAVAPANNSAASTPGAALTRYEIALETAKAVIAVRARSGADANWKLNAPPASLRALRALCVSLKSELARFDMDIPATLKLLDQLIDGASRAGSTPGAPAPFAKGERIERGENNARDDLPKQNRLAMSSLSQRLRVYSALDSLARHAHDPLRAAPTLGIKKLRAGASFDISPSLRLRGEFEERQNARPPGLREWLDGANFNASGRSERAFGAGADWALRPGVVFSGGVARVDLDGRAGDGLRFEGGMGLSGWQNRVALSAHLSRLVPEDSLALGITAARLNLGVEVTSQVQLKLMYQQLFGAESAGRGARIGGGIDFSF